MHPAFAPSAAEQRRPGTAIEPSALVVSHEVRLGSETAYEAWLQSVRCQCRQFDGHLGAEIIRPAPGTAVYTIVVRFDSMEHLGVWLNSPQRRSAIEAIEPHLAQGDSLSIRPGFDVWFTPAIGALKTPKRYKQYVLTVAVVFPLTIVLSLLFDRLWSVLGVQPHFIVVKLLSAVAMVALMVWVIFPVMTARLSRWLVR
jgi:uncharacterized protein